MQEFFILFLEEKYKEAPCDVKLWEESKEGGYKLMSFILVAP